jgi:putative chitinase
MTEGFDFEFTQDQLQKILPKVKNIGDWYSAMIDALPQYEINTVERVSAFIAQCAHESGGFTLLQENLNYGAKGLTGTFHKYFPTEADAKPYERQPEKIANRVYANRMGNGDEHSGEGWKYRGRGLIQLTGKDNYRRFSHAAFDDDTILDNPDLLMEPYYALHSACWFWNDKMLNDYADTQDLVTMTKKINGGTIGLDDRIHHYNHVVEVLHG